MANVVSVSYIRAITKLLQVVVMNKILVLNGLLLLSLMGLVQCVDLNHVSLISKFQWAIYPFVGSWVYNQITYFVLAAFIAPLIAFASAKKLQLSRIQASSLLIVNPFLFFVVSFNCQPALVPHEEFKVEHLLGPTRIIKFVKKGPDCGTVYPSLWDDVKNLAHCVVQPAGKKENGS